MTMRQTLSEFMGCKNWDKGELCELVDKLHLDVKARDGIISRQHEEIKARDELIRDMFDERVERSFRSGPTVRTFIEDVKIIKYWKKRVKALGIEV